MLVLEFYVGAVYKLLLFPLLVDDHIQGVLKKLHDLLPGLSRHFMVAHSKLLGHFEGLLAGDFAG